MSASKTWYAVTVSPLVSPVIVIGESATSVPLVFANAATGLIAAMSAAVLRIAPTLLL